MLLIQALPEHQDSILSHPVTSRSNRDPSVFGQGTPLLFQLFRPSWATGLVLVDNPQISIVHSQNLNEDSSPLQSRNEIHGQIPSTLDYRL